MYIVLERKRENEDVECVSNANESTVSVLRYCEVF